MRIWDPGWKKFGSGIRDKHPGFATLIFVNFLLNIATPVMYYRYRYAFKKIVFLKARCTIEKGTNKVCVNWFG
jgi:hypothetical protein